MAEIPTQEQIVAMAVAAIAEEAHTDASHIRVIRFARVRRSGLERYVEEHGIDYHKYQLGDEAL